MTKAERELLLHVAYKIMYTEATIHKTSTLIKKVKEEQEHPISSTIDNEEYNDY